MKMEKNWVVSAIILLLIGIVGTAVVSWALDCSDGNMGCIVGKAIGLAVSSSFVVVAFGIFLDQGIYDYCKKRRERF